MSADPPPIAELIHVSRVWDRGRIQALRDVSLAIPRRAFVGITGPSGSGKSTLLHIAGGLLRPSTGEVIFDGVRPRSRGQWASIRARRIGFVFQAFHLLPSLTARENVEVPMMGVTASARVRRMRAEQLLDRVGLSARLDSLPNDLSGGERQRVAIARALANSPDLLLADEPTGNLDSEAQDVIVSLLHELQDEIGLTVILVSHDLDLVRTAGRLVRLRDGCIDPVVAA